MTCLPLTRFPPDRQITYHAVRLTTTWRPAGLSVPRHTHDLTSLAFCLDGPFEETIGAGWQHVDTTSLVIRPGGGPHANRYPPCRPSRTLIIEILPRALDEIRSETGVLDAPGHLESADFVLAGRRLDVESRIADSVSGLAVEALVFDLIVSTTRAGRDVNGTPRWLARVQEYLDSRFTETIRLSELARIAGVHASHVARVFRRTRGHTIGEYLRRRRVEHAATLLKEGSLSLAETAVTCGFHDQSHFTRVFKTFFRISPGQYASLVRRRR